jgi:hypothetical protein
MVRLVRALTHLWDTRSPALQSSAESGEGRLRLKENAHSSDSSRHSATITKATLQTALW